LEEHIASTFMQEGQAEQDASMKAGDNTIHLLSS
jgi:hypothetical protein